MGSTQRNHDRGFGDAAAVRIAVAEINNAIDGLTVDPLSAGAEARMRQALSLAPPAREAMARINAEKHLNVVPLNTGAGSGLLAERSAPRRALGGVQ